MSSLPLFIGLPLAPSLSKALQSVEKDGFFSPHIIPFDADILMLMLATRPCASIFSITGDDSYERAFQLLDQFKRIQKSRNNPLRDPALRMILIAEHWAVQLERWMEVGIHEFIPAPISQKALVFKLNRHYAKAATAPLDAAPPPPEDFFATSDECILVKDTNTSANQGQVFCIPAGQTPADKTEQTFERFVIKAEHLNLIPPDSVWRLDEQGGGFEETWTCLLPERDPESGQPVAAIHFTGERPSYQSEAGCWLFTGEAPRLVRRNLSRFVEEEVLISTSVDRMNVFVKEPENYAQLGLTKRTSRGLRKIEQPVRYYVGGEFRERKEPLILKADGKEAESIADFLDSWEPKGEAASGAAAPAAPAPTSEKKAAAKDRPEPAAAFRTKASEDPLPGHYTGPGMREDQPEFNIMRAKGSREDEEPLLKPGASGAVEETGEAARQKSNTGAAAPRPETGVREKAQPATGESGAMHFEKSTEADRWGWLKTPGRGKDPAEPGATAARTSPDERSLEEIRRSLKPASAEDGAPVADDETKAGRPRRAAGSEEPDGEPRAPRAAGADDETGPSGKSAASGEQPAEGGATLFAGDSAAGSSNTTEEAPVAGEDLQLHLKGEGEQDNDLKRFGSDLPEGALTWSMQSDESDERRRARSKDGDADASAIAASQQPKPAAGAKAPLAAAGAVSPPTGPAEPGGTGAADATPAAASNNEPREEPEGPPTFFERVRRFLVKIFS